MDHHLSAQKDESVCPPIRSNYLSLKMVDPAIDKNWPPIWHCKMPMGVLLKILFPLRQNLNLQMQYLLVKHTMLAFSVTRTLGHDIYSITLALIFQAC